MKVEKVKEDDEEEEKNKKGEEDEKDINFKLIFYAFILIFIYYYRIKWVIDLPK